SPGLGPARPAPTPTGLICGPSLPATPITIFAEAAIGVSNPSARSRATSRSRCADCGSTGHTSTTAPFRRCTTCWSRRRKGRPPSCGASTWWTRPSCDPRQQPVEGFCFDTRLVGNSNGGHVYGTALSAAEKSDLLAYLLTF